MARTARTAIRLLTGTALLAAGSLAVLTPAQADDAGIRATWSCNGIPPGSVSLQIDPYRCGGTGPVHLVSAPSSGQWICGWNGDALNGYVVDVTEVSSTRCHFNTAWHIVAV